MVDVMSTWCIGSHICGDEVIVVYAKHPVWGHESSETKVVTLQSNEVVSVSGGECFVLVGLLS